MLKTFNYVDIMWKYCEKLHINSLCIFSLPATSKLMDARTQVVNLPIWNGQKVDPQPLSGGMTNVNFVVENAGKKYVVRIGDDIPQHQVKRFNELASSKAAYAVGISPEVIYHESGALVIAYVESHTLNEEDVRKQKMLSRILPLIKRCHQDVSSELRGPVLMFWVFHLFRDYAHSLHSRNSHWCSVIPDLLQQAEKLEKAVGQIDVVFSHNDLLAANFLDDGERLWLIDWDYAGFNSPLFDLGGLASNNSLDEKAEVWLLENYFEKSVGALLWHQYSAMKCASILRESMWGMVSEHFSKMDIDYRKYSSENLQRFNKAYDIFINS